MRTAILISGMHRSGTSALARTLSLLGGSLPADLVPANAGNPHGHWEPSGMVALNDQMLANAGSDLYSAIEIDAVWFASPAAKRFRAEAESFAGQAFSGDPVVLKDPRTALLAPIWNEALKACGYRVAHVIPLRPPADVAESLRRRHLQDFPYDAWISPRGEAVWLRYMLAALNGSQGHARVFVRYSDLLDDWRSVTARIAQAAELTWPHPDAASDVDAFLHGNARAETSRDPVVPVGPPDALGIASLADELYRRLCKGEGDTAAMAASFERRMAGARDLVVTLEKLYPVVWQFFQAGETAQQRLMAAVAAEADLRANVQRTWAALTQANSDKLALQQTTESQQRRISSIEGEMARHGAAIDVEQARAVGTETEQSRLAGALAEAQSKLAAANAHITAMEASSSWRLAAPLRFLARKVLGRS